MQRQRILTTTALAAAAFLAGCGGSDAGNQSPRVAFTRVVSFGDSLSDVGTYRTALLGEQGVGLYSINGDFAKAGLPYTNWTQYLSATLQVSPPCAARVGLDAIGDLQTLAQPEAAVANCFNYAQGGARVSQQPGPGNNLTYTLFGDTRGLLGQLTEPIVTQVANFKADSNTFGATDVVTVLGGGNDLFINRAVLVDAAVQAQIIAGGGTITPAGAAIIAGQADAAVAAMTQAGTELATLIRNDIVGAGATHVVVVNLPDVSLTPDNTLWITTGAGAAVEPIHPHLTLDMTDAFNAALQTGLFGTAGTDSDPAIVWVDAFTQSDMQVQQPATYGLTNLTTPACDLSKTGITAPAVGFRMYPSALFCTKDTLIPTQTATVTDTDPTGVLNYLYADTVHPTPFGYRLLAQYAGLQMAIKGWL